MAALPPPSIRFLEKAILDPNMAFNAQRDGIRLLQAALAYPDKLDLLYRFMHPKVSMCMLMDTGTVPESPYCPLRSVSMQLMKHAPWRSLVPRSHLEEFLIEMQPHALSRCLGTLLG